MVMHVSCNARRRQSGAFAVEFALVLMLFLAFVFGAIELARAMYVFNTLQEVTRRGASAAANTNFQDETAKNRVRNYAVFRATNGQLLLADPVTDQHVRIDYLALVHNGNGNLALTPIDSGALPSSPAANRVICMANPNDATCIRFVRVRLCDPANTSTCNAVPYKTMVSLIGLPITLPMATTIIAAGPLGYTPGMTP